MPYKDSEFKNAAPEVRAIANSDSFLFNKIVPTEKLSQIDMFNPINPSDITKNLKEK